MVIFQHEIETYIDLHGFDEDEDNALYIIEEHCKENENGTLNCKLAVYTDEEHSEYKPTFYDFDDAVDTDHYPVYCGEVTLTLKP